MEGEVRQVPVQAAAQAMADGAVLVDVREQGEWEAARVPGSVWLPLSQIQDRWTTLPDDRPILVLCAAGMRSHAAARFLRQNGVPADNVAGGIQAWYQAGLPLEG